MVLDPSLVPRSFLCPHRKGLGTKLTRPYNVLVYVQSSLPPTTKSLLGRSGIVVLPNHGSGMFPLSLTQELVMGRKACLLERYCHLCVLPQLASRLPLRLAAAHTLIGVSRRVFQTDVQLVE